MKDQGYINDNQYNDALAEKITFKQKQDNIQAPHFVFYVKEKLIEAGWRVCVIWECAMKGKGKLLLNLLKKVRQ